MIKQTLIVSCAAILFAGCAANPADDKAKAQTTDAKTQTATTRTAKGEAVAVKPETSKIEFVGSKVTGKHDGGFKAFSGMIDLVNSKPETSQVAIDIDMNSVFTDAEGLTAHLKEGDFFETAKHPKSSFVSTKITPDAAKGADNYTVVGDLEMRGVKKEITFPAVIKVDPKEVAVDSEFAINRKDFGIVYAGKADNLIRDEVVMKLNLRAPRAAK